MASPTLSDTILNELLTHIEDYQVTHGSLIKLSTRNLSDWDDSDDDGGLNPPLTIARPAGVSIVPTPLPRHLFNQALQLQPLFNELYIKVAEDVAWLRHVLEDMIQHDDFTSSLWAIWERAKDAGEMQPVRCAIWRSDYMLQQTSEARSTVLDTCELKQVEFNTYSCAGACHANIVADMHRHLARRGFNDGLGIRLGDLPTSNNTKNIVKLLESAHKAYSSPSGATTSRPKAILMTVQPNNINICDERPIEYDLGDCDPPLPLFRVEFSADVLKGCWLGDHRELLLRPPGCASEDVIYEISVVYQRAGYDAEEYDENGVRARVLLEGSWAIKCPSILSHISGFKKVQQELTRPGVLERFVGTTEAALLRDTFMDMYPLDDSEAGIHTRDIVYDEKRVSNFILKPSLEGGGHNVYGSDIPRFLATVAEDRWSSYILMRKIVSPVVQGQLKSADTIYRGPVISELGVVGTCLWRRHDQEANTQMIVNEQSGWTLKTKASHVKEMSVVKGYGCFDCPDLIDTSLDQSQQ